MSTEDLDTARGALPEYMNNKKLVAMPFRVGGKPHFLDLSYMIPLANLSEIAEPGGFIDAFPIDPSANPLFSFGSAALTGVDPFSGRPIEPRMTADVVTTQNENVRKAVGLGEHMMKTMLPPLAGGYAFENLYEAARGTRSPVTGEELEPSMTRTILANVAGLRTYSPDVNSQINNVRREQSRQTEAISQAWRRWERARANADEVGMEKARQDIIARKTDAGVDGRAYFDKNMKNHIPGSRRKIKRGLSRKNLEEVLERRGKLEKMGVLDEQDRRLLEELQK
jgi:hypothetical protein